MIPRVRLGKTDVDVTRIGLGAEPFGLVNRANDWDPFSQEGRKMAIHTIHAAQGAGINYIDTAPSYGDGLSEILIGEAIKGRRGRVFLATKVPHQKVTSKGIAKSIADSMKRLQTDYLDLVQFHGNCYSAEDNYFILNQGLLETLVEMRSHGLIRFIGFTVEEPLTALPLIETGYFDVVQVRYNFIHQSAALNVLNSAVEYDLGVVVMKPMTSGVLERIAEFIAPLWSEAHDLYEVALKFVLSHSRVHVANVGMRSPEEVAKNVSLAESFDPPFDMAELPRQTSGIYLTDDERRMVR